MTGLIMKITRLELNIPGLKPSLGHESSGKAAGPKCVWVSLVPGHAKRDSGRLGSHEHRAGCAGAISPCATGRAEPQEGRV